MVIDGNPRAELSVLKKVHPCETTIRSGRIAAYTIPTDAPEADGTFAWNKTTIVIAEVEASGVTGIGYTYADNSTAKLAQTLLEERIINRHDALDISAIALDLSLAVRNLGRLGVASMAISALDNACWDLKAKLLQLPLVRLLGQVRDSIDIYGSGGFTSYSDEQLRAQLGGWAKQGINRVKMKIGSDPARDLHRVGVARDAIGPDVQLFVDANGAYTVKQALRFAEEFAEPSCDVRWFEEPVSSDDLAGLHFIREHAPPTMDIAAGEYGYTSYYFERMLEAGAVDILQADATRCGGVTGFLAAHAISDAHHRPLSAHCAPTLHMHLCCATARSVHVEYFHDHVRIERMIFDGMPEPIDGKFAPDLTRHGLGIELKRRNAEKFAA
jgi:L-alanine-DL-glutamate epimerase-like enolase superfamily enzyme